MNAKLNGKGSKLQKKKKDFFFPSDKDIRKDVKAWQGHLETHQGTMVMPWSTLGDIGIKVLLSAIKVLGDNHNVKKDVSNWWSLCEKHIKLSHIKLQTAWRWWASIVVKVLIDGWVFLYIGFGV